MLSQVYEFVSMVKELMEKVKDILLRIFSYYSSQDIKYVANSYVKNNLSRDLNANKVGKDVY